MTNTISNTMTNTTDSNNDKYNVKHTRWKQCFFLDTIFMCWCQVNCPQLFMPAGNDGPSVKVLSNYHWIYETNKTKLYKMKLESKILLEAQTS